MLVQVLNIDPTISKEKAEGATKEAVGVEGVVMNLRVTTDHQSAIYVLYGGRRKSRTRHQTVGLEAFAYVLSLIGCGRNPGYRTSTKY